jgi:lipopolysaccharide export system ATP-binding protein
MATPRCSGKPDEGEVRALFFKLFRTPTALANETTVPAAEQVVTNNGANGSKPVSLINGLIAENLKKVYRGRVVVNGVSLAVSPGEIVGLLGPNGAGKTTSFYMMVGLERPDDGRIMLGEQELTHLPMYKRARAGLGYLPQEPSVFRKLTVEQNILALLQYQKMTGAEQRQRLEELIEEFHLSQIRRSKGYVLSGGERRRTEIARSLTTNPKFMLLDEPFAGIDPIAVDEVQQLVLRLRDKGIGVLITDHNVRETLSIVDRAYIISEGQIFRAGTPQQLADDAEVRRVYLGEKFRL